MQNMVLWMDGPTLIAVHAMCETNLIGGEEVSFSRQCIDVTVEARMCTGPRELGEGDVLPPPFVASSCSSEARSP